MKLLLALLFALVCWPVVAAINVIPPSCGLSGMKWINNGCYPYYGTVVNYDATTAATPPCPGQSQLVVIPKDCVHGGSGTGYTVPTDPATGSSYTNGTVTFSPDGSSASFTSLGDTQSSGYSGSQSVYNSTGSPVAYAQTKNGQMTGNVVIVPPGGTGTMPVTGGPGDGNQWGVVALPDGSSISASSSNWTTNPDGTQNATQATITGAGGSSGSGFYNLSGNSDQPVSTNSIVSDNPNWTYSSNSVPPPPGYVATNAATGGNTALNTNVTQNGGGVNYTGGGYSTNTVTQSNMTSYVNSEIAANHSDSQDIVKAIQTMDNANRAGQAAMTNQLGFFSGLLAGITNILEADIHSVLTNMPDAMKTNAMTDLDSRSNSAVAAMRAATNGASAVGFGSLPGNVNARFSGTLGASSGGGGVGSWVIGSPEFVLTITPPSPGEIAPVGVVKDLIAWAAYVSLFLACYRAFVGSVKEALITPQTTTAGEQVLGTNANFVSALVVAGFIVGVVAVLSAYGVALLGGMLENIVANPFSSISAIAGWGVVTQCCPFDVILGCVVSHVVFRMAMDGMTVVTMGVIKFFVGL